MTYLEKFEEQTDLIKKYGKGDAYLLWIMGYYLDFADLSSLELESLTDRSNDRKIDFIRIDHDKGKIIVVQGYFSQTGKHHEEAPAKKASDLNTAAAWLVDGRLDDIPDKLRDVIVDCRREIEEGEIDEIEMLYVHNCSESKNVQDELDTLKRFLEGRMKDLNIEVNAEEFGVVKIQNLFISREQSITINGKIECRCKVYGEETNPNWSAALVSVNGDWLFGQYEKNKDLLFSSNYRGFLGISKKRKINTKIKQTAEEKPESFFVFNNGISILTKNYEPIVEEGEIVGYNLDGISIINGAQTTGSLSSVQKIDNLKKINVFARIIKSPDSAFILDVIKYNNTQNSIKTWDQYSNDPIQERLKSEFKTFGHDYTIKRTENALSMLGMETVAQPVIALHGFHSFANRGRNYIFETRTLYKTVFEDSKARHILFAYCLTRACELVYDELKAKDKPTTNEEKQLIFFRNMRFKLYLVAIVGNSLEAITGKRITRERASFTYDSSFLKNYTIDSLIWRCVPVIKFTMPIIIKTITTDIGEYIRNEDNLKIISDVVSSTIESIKSIQPLAEVDAFSEIIEQV